jgi:predicted dehydrogenase
VSGEIGIGVLGLGGRGLYLGAAFDQLPGARTVAVCDLNAKRFGLAKERIGNDDLGAYTSGADMLADPKVDAVVVATHDRDHAACGIEVLRAGKHLFLEKPMAQTIADCDAMIRAWQEAQTVFLIGLELRYCSVCEDMKAILQRGDIGPVRVAYAVDNVSVGGQYFYHDRQRTKAYIGNLLLQKGTHSIDLMNWFIDSEPVRVFAEGGVDAFGGDEPNDKRCRDCEKRDTCPHFMPSEFVMDYGETLSQKDDLCVWAQEVDVEDNTIVVVRYANGAKMTFVECHFTPDYNRHFTLIGTKGRLVGFYNNEQDFRIEVTYRHSKRRDVIHSERREGGHGGGDPRIQAEFIRRIQQGKPACPGVTGARNSTAIAAAAGESSETGEPVTIPPCPLSYDATVA